MIAPGEPRPAREWSATLPWRRLISCSYGGDGGVRNREGEETALRPITVLKLHTGRPDDAKGRWRNPGTRRRCRSLPQSRFDCYDGDRRPPPQSRYISKKKRSVSLAEWRQLVAGDLPFSARRSAGAHQADGNPRGGSGSTLSRCSANVAAERRGSGQPSTGARRWTSR